MFSKDEVAIHGSGNVFDEKKVRLIKKHEAVNREGVGWVVPLREWQDLYSEVYRVIS